MPSFQAVLFDWVGTLIVPKWGPTQGRPRGAAWIEGGLQRLGREAPAAEVARLSAALEAAGARPEVASGWAGADLSAAAHRASCLRWFAAAGVDGALADALQEGLSEPVDNRFAVDVEPTLRALQAAGVRVAVVSDIHVDIRPAFVRAGLDAHVDAYVLSFEQGACKPDPAVFRAALECLGVGPEEALMVGDRSGPDGGAVEAGITTLLVPPLTDPAERRLHLVLGACGVAT